MAFLHWDQTQTFTRRLANETALECGFWRGFGLGGASHGIRKQENKRSFQSVVSQLIKKTTAALQVRTDQAHVLCLLKLLCLHLYDLDTDWYLWSIIAVDNQMIKFGKMSLRVSHYFVFMQLFILSTVNQNSG